MLLAIDTSSGTTVAVVHAGRVVSEATSADTRSHAELIGPFLDEVLREAGRPRLVAVAVGMGPGPFTGLRVGIAAARSFAGARGIPVVPLVSHDAVAFAVGGPCTVLTDARRREVARSVYAGPDADGIPVRVDGPALVPRQGDPRFAVPSAAQLGLLAERLIDAGAAAGGPQQPVYLRAPDAVPPARPKSVTT